MKSFSLVIGLIAGLLLQSGCNITFKRNSNQDDVAQSSEISAASKMYSKSSQEKIPLHAFTHRDIKLIALYYSKEGNAQALSDIIKQTSVNSKIQSKLKKNEIIPNDVLVIPLPLGLEKILSPLSGYELRVQVGKRVMLIDIKSRRILDVIKLQ